MSTNKLSRDYLVDLVVNKYFANVDRHNMQPVLDCFTADAFFTIQSAFTDHEGRDTGIRRMFETFFATYKTSIHKDFHHVPDIDNNAIASQFNVYLQESDGKETRMSNCNFFYLENGKFKRIAQPKAGASHHRRHYSDSQGVQHEAKWRPRVASASRDEQR